MVHEKYHDPIKVLTLFDGQSVQPKKFYWGRNFYDIRKVLTVHSINDGRETIHYFSVANDTEFFKLAFHTETMNWYLLEHYQN